MSFRIALTTLVGLLAWGVGQDLQAQQVRVSIENRQSSDGFYLTPLWVGFHDGTFDYFDANSAASGSLELLAEEGDASALSTDFGAASTGTDSVIMGPAGFGGAPVIDPGETASALINVNDAMTNRFFSYASMVIPSNDAFIGNDVATAYEIFDIAGNFNGPVTIDIFSASDVWDAGTEANDGLGAPFSANGGSDTAESLLVRIHPGLDNFVGTDTAAGTTIGAALDPATPVATITLTAVPEPSTWALLGAVTLIGGIALLRRRRPAVALSESVTFGGNCPVFPGDLREIPIP